jgi:hypothetical protein
MALPVCLALASWFGPARGVRTDAPAPWRQLAPGLDLGAFATSDTGAADSSIVVLRIDPERWSFRLLCISETGDDAGFTAKQWAEKTGAVAVINAGMFDVDYRTHVGYLRTGQHVNCARTVTDYRSAFAFSPRRPSDRHATLFDLDTLPLDSVLVRYDAVVQNLRLISRPGTNRWSQQPRTWSEAALAEDQSGRVLFIFVSTPLSMHDLNLRLLDLPLGITCAQHLEGGPEAQLYVDAGGRPLEWIGSSETGFMNGNTVAWPVPNALAVLPRP